MKSFVSNERNDIWDRECAINKTLLTNLKLLFVLDEMNILTIKIMVSPQVVGMSTITRSTRILVRGRRYQEFRTRFLHMLIDTINTIHGRTTGTISKIGQEEKRAETNDTERQKHEKDQVLFARTKGSSRKQLCRHAIHDSLIRRQNTRR